MTTIPPHVLNLAIARAESLVRRLRTGELTGFCICATQPDGGAALMHGGVFDTTTMVGLLEAKKLQLLQDFVKQAEGYQPGDKIQAVPEPEPTQTTQITPTSAAYCASCEVSFSTEEAYKEHHCGPKAI